LALGLLFWAEHNGAAAHDGPRRVLMLYPYNNLYPVSVITGDAARKRMTEQSREPLELYSDFLDLGRFSGPAHESRMAQYLSDKYKERRPEVVLALGPEALRFVNENRSNLGFGSPIVFCCTSRARLAALGELDDVTGVISEFDLTKTLALAQRLQPDARHLVIVAGATEFDQQWVRIARRQLASFESRYDTTYLAGLRYADLMERLKRLSRDSIVIMLTMFADGAGRLFISPEAVQEITNVATAPVYAPYETYLGGGVVGGHVDSLAQIGEEIADLALGILARADPSSLALRTVGGGTDRVDWRALKRWNLSESALPASTEVRFRESTLWEQYRWHVIALLSIMLLEGALIAWLFFERFRRHRTEAELRGRLLEVTHLNRTAAAGALSASFAHELNQPLGAILSNADAAEVLIASDWPDLTQLKEIIADIRRDDQRAAEIISRVRVLMKTQQKIEFQDFDLNDAVQRTLQLLNAEALRRGITLTVGPAQDAILVHADPVHVQQVVVNLAMNAIDATQGGHTGSMTVTVQTALVGAGKAEVSVSDSGLGIPDGKLAEIFRPFFTTKPNGTGLGLSIARTIVETYGGKIWAENRLEGGAIFRFTVPLSGPRLA
jgi:signal transduction histidine kinase